MSTKSKTLVLSLIQPTDQEVIRLVRVLRNPPGENLEQYLTWVTDLIEDLPFPLRRHRFIVPSLFLPSHPAAPCCTAHKGLNNRLIRSLLNCLELEVGIRCNAFVANNNMLNPDQWEIVRRVRELHSLWLSGSTYRKTFLETPSSQWPYQEDRCEACILTRIGSDRNILICLRTVLLSRTRSNRAYPDGHYPPRLLRWVEAWINVVPRDWRAMLKDSDEYSIALKAIRKEIWKARREKKHSSKAISRTMSTRLTTTVTFSKDNSFVEQVDSDLENEVIDAYAALTSTPYLPLFSAHQSGDAQRAYTDLDRPFQEPRSSFVMRRRGSDASSEYSRPEHEYVDFHPPAPVTEEENEDKHYTNIRNSPEWQRLHDRRLKSTMGSYHRAINERTSDLSVGDGSRHSRLDPPTGESLIGPHRDVIRRTGDLSVSERSRRPHAA